MSQAETVIMTCAHCGQRFEGNPRSQPLGRDNYCSIGCEEGLNPVPMDDPQSPDYHLHLKAEPESLVGKRIIATGRKLVDYSPEWANGPDNSLTGLVWVDQDDELYVREDDVYVGEVIDYDGYYTIERENIETGEIHRRRVKDMLVVDQIRNDRWWVEG